MSLRGFISDIVWVFGQLAVRSCWEDIFDIQVFGSLVQLLAILLKMELQLIFWFSCCFLGCLGILEVERHLDHSHEGGLQELGEAGSCEYTFTSHHDTIESPNFPNRYNDSIDCYYHIYAGRGNVIHLRFWMLNIEPHSHCLYDYLLITDAREIEVARFCGFTVPGPLNVTEAAHLRFHSDPSQNYYGFQIEYFVSHSNCIFGDTSLGCALPCYCETSASQSVSCDPQTGQCVQGSCRYREAVQDILEERWGGPACQIGNVAYGKRVWQVGTFGGQIAEFAVDRRTGEYVGGNSYCAQTDGTSVPAWWAVDLGSTHRIISVVVYNTKDNLDARRLEDFSVRFGETPDVYQQQTCAVYKNQVLPGEHVVITCNVLARYLSIVREGGFEMSRMTLCEVEVQGHEYIDVDCTRCVGTCVPELYCDECESGYRSPSCRAQDAVTGCGEPPAAPSNGNRVVGGTLVGDAVTYACNLGYNLEGQRVLQCGDDGQWQGDRPTCDPVSCGPPPPTPTNGQRFIQGTLYLSIVRYSCLGDFVIDGPEEIRCEASGQWSDNAPICREKGISGSCGNPPSIANGLVSATSTGVGAMASIVCDGTLVEGTGLMVCLDTGEWAHYGEVSKCSECGGALEAKVTSTVISHPLKANLYRHSENCTWIIYAPHPGLSVRLSWFHVDIQPHVDCSHDSLDIHDGNGERLSRMKRVCGDDYVSDVMSKGDMILLHFQSDDTVEMTGFKAEFRYLEAPVPASDILSTFYPELGKDYDLSTMHDGIASALLYLLDTEIHARDEMPTYVYLVQSIDAVRYLTETVLLPRLHSLFLDVFIHTFVHSGDVRLSDVAVVHTLYSRISEPLTDLLQYFYVDYSSVVPPGDRISCFSQLRERLYSMAHTGISGQQAVMSLLELEQQCLSMIQATSKSHFLDQMQAGPFSISSGSQTPQSMYLLVRSYAETALREVDNRLESQLSSIPSIVSDMSAPSLYLSELRSDMPTLESVAHFLSHVKDNFTDNADQFLASYGVGWEMPQLPHYGRPILHSLLNVLFEDISHSRLHVLVRHSLPPALTQSDLTLSQIQPTHLHELMTALVQTLQTHTHCPQHKMAALAIGFALEHLVSLQESDACAKSVANSLTIDCDLVKLKVTQYYREVVTRATEQLDDLLGAHYLTETVPLGLTLKIRDLDIKTMAELSHYILDVFVPKFEAAGSCSGNLDVPRVMTVFGGLLNSFRVSALSDLVDDLHYNMGSGDRDRVKVIVEALFTDVVTTLQRLATVTTETQLLDTITDLSVQQLMRVIAHLSEDVKPPVNVPIDLSPVYNMLIQQEDIISKLVGDMHMLREQLKSALMSQGVNVCQQAPMLC